MGQATTVPEVSGKALGVGEPPRDDLHLLAALLPLEDEHVARGVVQQGKLAAQSLLCNSARMIIFIIMP